MKASKILKQAIKGHLAMCALMAIASGALTSCAVRTTEPITVNPDVLVITPNIDNVISLNTVLNVPANYVTQRGMVSIEPQLILDDTVAHQFTAFTLTGSIYEKKAERLRTLYNQGPSLSDNIRVKKNTAVNLEVREDLTIDNNYNSGRIEAYVTADGCDCQGTDTLTLAYLSNLSPLIDADNLLIQWIDTMPPIDEKYVKGEGRARLQFVVDKWDIVPSLAENAAQLDTMLARLTPVLTDSLSEIQSISIFGSASAEGGYEHNKTLAQNRANSAVEWMSARLNLPASVVSRIQIGSEPEGWGPVIASMHAAGDPDSAQVKRIVAKYPDPKSFEAERRIRKLKCWPEIADKHLAKDRKVIYRYEYKIRAFKTDEEKLEWFDKRPDAFNEQEFLRVAKLKEGNPDSLIYVYETMLRYKPNMQVAINNLGVLYYQNGKYDKAIDLIEKQHNPSDDMLTTLALCYIKEGDASKAIDVLNGLATPNAIYNLGVIQANNRLMADAYVNLQDARDLNTAIAALSVGENQEACDILNALHDNSEKANYVRAIAQTRLGNYTEAIRYLKKAIKDPAYRERALIEVDLMPLHDEWAYKQLFK